MKPIEQLIIYRKERFDNLINACNAYGVNPRYVHNFLSLTKNYTEALDQALHYKDLRTFYGLIVYPHKISGIITPSDSSDVERCNRIIRIQKNARVERFNHSRHQTLKNKFEKILLLIQKTVDNKIV